MHLVYIDDSKDEKHVCFSALLVPADQWITSLDHLIGMRKAMRQSDGIFPSTELHATDWLGGRGNIAAHAVPKGARARLFDYVLSSIARLPSVQIINAHAARAKEMQLFERLMVRIHKNVELAGSRAIIFSDEGKNYGGTIRFQAPMAHGQMAVSRKVCRYSAFLRIWYIGIRAEAILSKRPISPRSLCFVSKIRPLTR